MSCGRKKEERELPLSLVNIEMAPKHRPLSSLPLCFKFSSLWSTSGPGSCTVAFSSLFTSHLMCHCPFGLPIMSLHTGPLKVLALMALSVAPFFPVDLWHLAAHSQKVAVCLTLRKT